MSDSDNNGHDAGDDGRGGADDGRDTGNDSRRGADDGHHEFVLREDVHRKPSWLSTYGSPLGRIVLLVVLLAALIVLRKPCAEGVAGFVGNFGQAPRSRATQDGGTLPANQGHGALDAMTQRAEPAPPRTGPPSTPASAAGDAAPRH
jgi:hypothetical protein